MSSSFEKGICGLLSFSVLLSGCGLNLSHAPENRSHMPRLDASKYADLTPVDDHDPGLNQLHDVPASMTACRYLKSIPEAEIKEQNFRLLSRVFAESQGRPALDRGEGERACARVMNEGDKLPKEEAEQLWLKCNQFQNLPKGAVNLSNIYGLIDITSSPLYMYAGRNPDIPDRTGFIKRAEQEFSTMPQSLVDYLIPNPFIRVLLFPVLVPLYLLGLIGNGVPLKLAVLRAGLASGFIDPIKERNKIIEQRMNEAFPGAFTPSEVASFNLRKSFPEVIFRNGTPDLSSLAINELRDTPEQRFEKSRAVDSILANYTRPVALFRNGGWSDYRDDMRVGMTVAIRGFTSKDPIEEACATALMHRGLAQLLTIMGFERMVTERDGAGRGYLPTVPKLLDQVDGTSFRVCETTGSFARNDHFVMLNRDDLASYHPSKNPSERLDLSLTPHQPRDCRVADAYPLGNPTIKIQHTMNNTNPVEPIVPAKAAELVDFISGAAHFVMAFNPGAPWWKTPGSYPLSKFVDLEQILASNALLPFDAHALALAYFNIGVNNLLDKHLVYIDPAGREATGGAKVYGLRISDEPRKVGSGGKITNSIRTASLVAEVAYKFSDSLVNLAEYHTRITTEIAGHSKDPDYRELQDEYRETLDSLYGTASMVDDLTATGQGSIREELSDLQFGSALLLLSFAERLPDGRVTCAAALERDLDTGEEHHVGECTPEDRRLWKSALKMATKRFSSPLLATMAEQ